MKLRLHTLALIASASTALAQAPPQGSPRGHSSREIEGWSVRVSDALLAADAPAVGKALVLLGQQLAGIVRVLPPGTVAHLREVPLWFSPEYPGRP